ncbi:Peroxiredoxin [Spraguea lophii 42_110]|uniref:Peroxiredoxin n=1 Tax=Spraguea lophii (strain 42_110) TaxID=1358809 RepID=S7WC94_SPRLO|nr:Peroxiredoxin [Spraguea lophii 42_110]
MFYVCYFLHCLKNSMLDTELPDLTIPGVINGEIVNISLHSYSGKPLVLVFYPYDFSFICPKEINDFSDNIVEFEKLECNVVLVSCDSVYSHIIWSMISREERGIRGVKYPMIADYNKDLTKALNLCTPRGNSERATVIVDAHLQIKHISMVDINYERSIDEILRLIKAMVFVEKYGEVCYVDWGN